MILLGPASKRLGGFDPYKFKDLLTLHVVVGKTKKGNKLLWDSQ